MNTHRHTKEHVLIQTYTQTHTHAHTHNCARTHKHTHTHTDGMSHEQLHAHASTHTHLVKHLQTTKPRKYSQTRTQTLARACAHTHTLKRTHTHHAPTYAMGATDVHTLFSSYGALGLRGGMATPTRQGVWCLLPVVLNAVPIHTQCSDHYLRDEASWL